MSLRQQILEILFARQEYGFDAHEGLSEEGCVRCGSGTNNEPGKTTTKPKDANACVICLDDIGKKQRVSGLCHHAFHYGCIMEWMMQENSGDSCPTCKQPLWDSKTFNDNKRDLIPKHEHTIMVAVSSNDCVRGRQFPSQSRTLNDQRQERLSFFTWMRCFYAFNMALFLTGVGYLIGSVLVTRKCS